jgi:hypothetical protein
MSEDRRRVLQMLADDKISIDEAERLLAAMDAPSQDAAPSARPKAKYLRVMIDAKEGSDEPTRVNVKVPMQLLRAGVRLSSLIPEEARAKMNAALHEKGVDFDVEQLRPDNLEQLLEQLNDLSVNVETHGKEPATIRVFCE